MHEYNGYAFEILYYGYCECLIIKEIKYHMYENITLRWALSAITDMRFFFLLIISSLLKIWRWIPEKPRKKTLIKYNVFGKGQL